MSEEQTPEYIVAEINKSWINGEDLLGPTFGRLISQLFEETIEVNRLRGYVLYSFQLNQVMVNEWTLNETIIAVFRKVA